MLLLCFDRPGRIAKVRPLVRVWPNLRPHARLRPCTRPFTSLCLRPSSRPSHPSSRVDASLNFLHRRQRLRGQPSLAESSRSVPHDGDDAGVGAPPEKGAREVVVAPPRAVEERRVTPHRACVHIGSVVHEEAGEADAAAELAGEVDRLLLVAVALGGVRAKRVVGPWAKRR